MPADGDARPTPFPTTKQLRRIDREFVAMARSWFPRRFYGRTAQHQAFVGAALLRMCDTLDDMMVLMTHPGPSDQGARVLLRSLYEQAVRLSWVLIDQQAHHSAWVGHAQNELLTIHNSLVPFGETYLSAAQLANVQGATNMPSVEQMTREADSYWAPRVPGLHRRAKPKGRRPKKPGADSVADPAEHSKDSEPMLSFEGLYQTIYRTTSHSVHGSQRAGGIRRSEMSVACRSPVKGTDDGCLRAWCAGVGHSLDRGRTALPVDRSGSSPALCGPSERRNDPRPGTERRGSITPTSFPYAKRSQRPRRCNGGCDRAETPRLDTQIRALVVAGPETS
jgi:uncharacterized protein DUF5677